MVFALAGDSTMTSLRPLPAAMVHLQLPASHVQRIRRCPDVDADRP